MATGGEVCGIWSCFATVPLGDVYTNRAALRGMTTFGASVLKECNRLGMLIDLAHANVQTTEAALKLTTQPVIISHTGLDTHLGNDPRMAQMMRHDSLAKQSAGQDGRRRGCAVGVWTHLSNSPLEYAHNIRALVDVIGVDHVCIGTDTKLTQPALALQALHVGMMVALPHQVVHLRA